MKHYEISDWVDFVRGLLEPVKREAMDRHLAEGCEKCGRTAAMLGRVSPLARADSRYEPPEYAVHCARAICVLQQPGEVRVFTRWAGRLLFDSFREPLPAGVRSQQRVSRQTLYEAGEYTVDLRQEHERGGSRINVVGQVVSRKDPGEALAGALVVLSSGNTVLAEAVSNRFGEFQMEYAPARNLRLEIGAAAATGSLKERGIRGGLE